MATATYDRMPLSEASGLSTVPAANVNPLEHYLQSGIYEGRQIVSAGIWH